MSLRGCAWVLLGLALVVQGPCAAGDEGENVWGGQHVAMEVTKTGAELEFDCAIGSITEPLPLDKSGSFQVKGTFTREHGGPVRQNEPSATRNAIYSGTVDGDTLHLHIAVEGMSEGQDYVLTRGKPARVVKCR